MIADWQTNHVYFSGLLPQRHPKAWSGLKQTLTAAGIGVHLLADTRDIWCRDYMPVQVGIGEFVKFRYNPDYLSDCRDLATDEPVCHSLPHIRNLRVSPINLDGGNVVAGNGKVILTDKVFRENRQLSRKQPFPNSGS
jgi:agmatine deiminase